ncbi:MAG: Bax inhibitor-1/YccA family protein [Candidatus Gastranaerophilales bacterium]|nr:Bax inhibitor-1/YccA family protein [Candidatus Gastranaerophilales bacterium]
MANPILNDNFVHSETGDRVITGQTMTVSGTVDKTLLLFLCALLPAAYTWQQYTAGFTDKAGMLMTVGAIVGFVFALITAFTKNKIFVPLYAVCEGLFLGGISAVFNSAYPGIVIQAVIATFATMFSMLVLFRLRVIQCTDKFRSIVFTATISVAVLYLIQWIASFFHYSIPAIFGAGTVGIGFSAIVVIIAALNLILDFDFIEKGSQNMLPKDYEWYGAFGLMVTLVWLYLEILRLLAKLRDR